LGRTEDLAGLAVVALIASSAILAGWQAIERLVHPHTVHNLALVMVGGLIGLLGNEAVARIRIRTGRRIGSAALEADGIHARADGITSLLVLLGALGVAVHWNWADPVIGLVIAATIAVVLVQAVRTVGGRLIDAVHPSLVDQVSHILEQLDGIVTVSEIRLRWVGHRLYAAVRVGVQGHLSVADGHEISERACHELMHGLSQLADAIVHVDPVDPGGDPHEITAHHRRHEH
jgi:cation diffusion facilitator family transporter